MKTTQSDIEPQTWLLCSAWLDIIKQRKTNNSMLTSSKVLLGQNTNSSIDRNTNIFLLIDFVSLQVPH
jgi:hypothetical protein